MALPVILVDSATGSDTAASGAGPATALTGSSASTDAAGTLVTLDGSPDLSGVATDGSHVIYLADTTAGNRNFGKITAKDNVAKTVTVSNAFGLSLSGKSWAIGGKRASIGDTNSRKLLENNLSAGDVGPGWVIEFQSGHSETLSATLNLRRDGDSTNGMVTVRGAENASTKPILNWSNNSACWRYYADYHVLKNIEFRNTNATKTASVAIDLRQNFYVENITISNSTNNFWRGIQVTGNSFNVADGSIENCDIGNAAGVGINFDNIGRQTRVVNCFVHNCTSHGITITVGSNGLSQMQFRDCIIANNGGDGIRHTGDTTHASLGSPLCIKNCTIHGNTSDGIEWTTTKNGCLNNTIIENSIFSSNGGYGLNMSGNPSAALLNSVYAVVRNNVFYSNTSGTSYPSALNALEIATQTANPAYLNSGANNFAIGTGDKATGYPTTAIGINSNTYSYVDPGAAQRQEGSSSYSRGRVVNA